MLTRFLRDESGSVTIDFVSIFLPMTLLVTTVIEIGIAFHMTAAAQKAAQMGARHAATLPAVHAGVWTTNPVDPRFGEPGDMCFRPDGNDACLEPTLAGWACVGGGSDPACDGALFDAVLAEMRRTSPRLAAEDVTIRYDYLRLGVAGGPFVPHVSVTIAPRPSPVNFLSYAGLLELRETRAGTLGEDMG